MQTIVSRPTPLVLSADDAREGVTGNGVRYVLGVSLVMTVVSLAVLLVISA